jgi:pimeloyl-ACP methyl ester carboxylesterase
MTIDRRMFALSCGAASLGAGAGAAHAAPTAIDEGLFAPINGLDQWITIRGQDLRNPVLLWLHGGPGFPMSGMAPMFFDWERDFTVVQWDQPGGGATHAKNLAGEGPLTADRYEADAIAVIEWVRRRLHVDKVVLIGISWGTQLGVRVAQKRPDLVAAYVGCSQVVSGARGNLMGYQMALAAARARGDAAGVAALEKVGPPPYATVEQWFVRQQYTNPPGVPMSPAEAVATAAVGKRLAANPPGPDTHYVAKLPPYDFAGQFMAVQRAFYGQLGAFEAERLGLSFRMPVFIIQGEVDMNTPMPLARDYLAAIKAPKKGLTILPGAGHNTAVFQKEILAVLDRDVRPLVLKTAAPRA